MWHCTTLPFPTPKLHCVTFDRGMTSKSHSSDINTTALISRNIPLFLTNTILENSFTKHPKPLPLPQFSSIFPLLSRVCPYEPASTRISPSYICTTGIPIPSLTPTPLLSSASVNSNERDFPGQTRVHLTGLRCNHEPPIQSYQQNIGKAPDSDRPHFGMTWVNLVHPSHKHSTSTSSLRAAIKCWGPQGHFPHTLTLLWS